ncbi:hypothetical protein ACHAWO_014020 [Cyclotella atomus]|uniref:SnoaL-like domain-containing protein n=1 Tax=Cyclotella atomus TaxID=382360 RepID=A0ABD3QFR3_9STRA
MKMKWTPAATVLLLSVPRASAFSAVDTTKKSITASGLCNIKSSRRTTALNVGSSAAQTNILDSLKSIVQPKKKKFLMAQSLLLSLINDEKCFTTQSGAQKFADSCALNVIYEDCYEPQPIVGKDAVANHLRARAAARSDRGGDAGFRIDKISDGNKACGFAWTWTSHALEGLRGTTYVELNDQNQIYYVREIPEPLYKPGDFILDVLKAVTADAVPKPPPEYVQRTPRKANEIAKYLFNEVQGSSPDEAMRFFSESIVYRDFNYEEVLRGKAEVCTFIEDFSFPGITFATQRFDDGEEATCFTWEVVLEGAPEGSAIKGISFYEVDPETGLVTYVRDVPESGIKPPPLGKLARQLRPALGVLQPVPIGSREGGL